MAEADARQRALRTIRDARLVRAGDRVLIACSGGIDSICLTHILSSFAPELGLELGVCSIDHGLRAEAADELRHVEAFAAKLSLPFFGRSVQVKAGASLQAQARRARYEALFNVARTQGFGLIATGHTQDDQAETVLARILRSGSVAGLTAIALRRDDGVIRPLLHCSRKALEQYAERHGIAFVRDPSNVDERFERVRLRKTLRTIREIHPAIDHRLAELAVDAASVREVVRIEAMKIDVAEMSLCRTTLLSAPAAVGREVLARWVDLHCARKIGQQMQQQAFELVVLGRGELWLSDTFTLRVKADCVYLDAERRLS